MAINEPPAARRRKKDRSSIGAKTTDRSSIGRSSIGSKTLSFHQKKGRFAGGGFGGRSHKSDHLERIRKDALDDFTRATHKRSQSVHQMAAMYASSAMSAAVSSAGKTAADGGGRDELDASLPGAFTSPLKTGGGLGGLVSVPSGARTLESMVKEAQSLSEVDGANSGTEGEGEAEETPRPVSPGMTSSSPAPPSIPEPMKTKSFSGLSSTSNERARDLRKMHMSEALDVTSHRVGNVKDIASAFKGESRPENVEVFHKRHKEQEAQYRHKVHQGKETLKKTSQGTDAMYDFVLKLNLATTQGKALFMRKWAIGRIANGESITPREGWKFLQSLGIDVPKASTPTAQKTPANNDNDDAADLETANPVDADSSAGHNKAATATPTTPTSRGRGRVRLTPGRFGRTAAGDGGEGGGGGGVKQQEAAAWEVAMSEAVGAVVRVDADACAPKLAFHHRRRSGSEPRKAPANVPRAPDTCRAPRSKSFFFGSSDSKAAAAPPPAKSDDGLLLAEEDESEDEEDAPGRISMSASASGLSPTGSNMAGMGGLAMTMELWRQEAREGRPQSQALGTRGPSLESCCRASVSSRLSDGLSLSPTRSAGGVRISMNPRYDSPGRFDLSPGRASNGRSPLTPTEKADRSAAAALSAKVSWDRAGPLPPPLDGGLQLPQRLFAGRDGGDGDDGSEERFDHHPVVAGPRGGFGGGATAAAEEEEEEERVLVPGRSGGGGEELLSTGHGGGGGCDGAGNWVLDISCEEEQEEKDEDKNGGPGTAVAAAGGLGDDPQARANRLSAVSVVGPGTLSDEEEEEEGSFMADFGEQSGGKQGPRSPEVAAAPPAPGVVAVTAGQVDAASPRQDGTGAVEPAPPPVDDDAEDGDDAEEEQDSVLMKEIARMDEESILLEAESDLMAVAINSDADSDDDEEEDKDGRRGAEAPQTGKQADPEMADPPTAGGGSRSSLDDSGYAPDAETTVSAAEMGDGNGDDAEADKAAPGEDDGGEPEKHAVLPELHLAAEAKPEADAEAKPEADAEAAVEKMDGTDDAQGGGITDSTDEDDRSGYAPSAEEEEDREDGGRSAAARETKSAAGGNAAAAAAAVVDNAVRETLEDLTSGVAILVGDEQLLSCSEVLSEVLSELQSDAGDVDNAAGDEDTAASVGDGGMKDDVSSVVGGKAEAPHKSLKIAVGSDLQEEEPPVPRLQWGVNSILMDSPLTPSRYDSVGGGSREPSTCSVSPCRLAFTGLLDEQTTEDDAERGGRADAEPLTIEVEEDGGDAAGGEDDALEGARVSSPWGGVAQALMSPLSPLSGGSSPEVLEASELTKPEKWGIKGRLSVLSEGRESRASGMSAVGDGGNDTGDGLNDTDGGGNRDTDEGAGGLKKARCMTGGTEETASPSSRRVSTESLPPTDKGTAAAAIAGGDNNPAANLSDPAQEDGESAEAGGGAAAAAAAAAAADKPLLTSQDSEAASATTTATALAVDNSSPEKQEARDRGSPTAVSTAAAAAAVPVPVTGLLAPAPEAALGLPLPATPAGSPGGKVSPAAPASSPLDSPEMLMLPAGLEGGGDGEYGGVAAAKEILGGLTLNAASVPNLSPNPYQDFDELHDRDHFSAATVELDCKTPGGMFNFCRPRSGTVYESAKGPGPGFFSADSPSATPATKGAGRQERDVASPGGVVLDDAHQGCTIA